MITTPEINELKDRFKQDGYCIVRSLISCELVERLMSVSLDLQDLYPSRIAWNEQILLRREPFFELFLVHEYPKIVSELLGQDLQLLAIDLRRIPSKMGGFDWHRDVNWVCDRSLTVNTAIYLRATSKESGCLYFLPKQLSDSIEISSDGSISESFQEQAIPVEVSPGDVIFHDGAILHTGSKNCSLEDNWAVYPHFGHFWIKRMDRFFKTPLPTKIEQSCDPLIRQLFGLELREDVSDFLGDSATYAFRGEVGVDYLEGMVDPRAVIGSYQRQ